MEINGTWYAKDCIKVVERVVYNKIKRVKEWEFCIVIIICDTFTREYIYSETQKEAEQSRNELIKQLEK